MGRGGAYGADSQRDGVCATEGVDGGRWSAGLGQRKGRTSRVERSWRRKCHHCSHQLLSTASHDDTGARSFFSFLAITRTVTAQEARLRTGPTRAYDSATTLLHFDVRAGLET